MKKILLITLFNLLIIVGYSQERKKVFFLADTSGVKHDKRLSITYGSPFERTFIFDCHCIGNYHGHFNFVTRIGKKFSDKFVERKPYGKYVVLDDLIKLVVKEGYSFDNLYELIIVEPFNGRYRVSGVKREVLPPPSDDTIYIH